MTLGLAVFAVLTGSLAGLALGLLGAGSSILVVPLLVYGLHIPPHLAIGTATASAAVSALWGLSGHARAGSVRWRYGGTYAVASVLGAATGAAIGKVTGSEVLLTLLGTLMIVVAGVMLRRAVRGRRQVPRSELHRAGWVLPLLGVTGFAVGSFGGLVGVGGGFLTVPALMFITGMPLINAVASSLLSVTAVAATTATSYAFAHMVLWPISALLICGGLVGGYVGVKLAIRLGGRKQTLSVIFSTFVACAGLYIITRSLLVLL